MPCLGATTIILGGEATQNYCKQDATLSLETYYVSLFATFAPALVFPSIVALALAILGF